MVLGLLAVGLVSAALLGSGLLSEDAAFTFSQPVYVIVPIGAGLVVVGAALSRNGKERLAWLLIGSGVLAWGIGETIWVAYEYLLEMEVPYPGWADVFYVLGYPVMFAGILLLPHVKPGRMERLRLSLDALAGTIALAAILWVAYLSDQIYLDPEIGFLEQFVNIMYPLGDVILLIGLMILAVRRSSRRFDIRLLALAIGMIVTALADIIYLLQVEADTYVSGGWLDSWWLVGYAGFIAAGWYLHKPAKETEQTERATKVWQMAAPYSFILILFGLTLFDSSAEASVLQIASGIVGVLIIGRQGVAIRENRELVEKQRDDLIASISHELKTPLTSVQGFAELLSENGEQLDPEQRAELTGIIEKQSRHLGGIVSDLIDVARDQLSSTNLTLEVHDLAELISDATTMLPNGSDNGDTIEIHTQPGIEVEADRRRMTQVVVNLLTNAKRYGQGKIKVETLAENDRVTIRVHDNGPGVPKRYEEAIWERFERGAHRLDATTPGSGIGLPIARSLIQAHRGSIRYEPSDQLGGACFTISMPRVSGSPAPVREPVASLS